MYLVSNEIAVLEILVGLDILDKNDWKILESTNIKFYVHVFFHSWSYLYCHITLKLQISSPLYKNYAMGGIRTRGSSLGVPRRRALTSHASMLNLSLPILV